LSSLEWTVLSRLRGFLCKYHIHLFVVRSVPELLDRISVERLRLIDKEWVNIKVFGSFD